MKTMLFLSVMFLFAGCSLPSLNQQHPGTAPESSVFIGQFEVDLGEYDSSEIESSISRTGLIEDESSRFSSRIIMLEEGNLTDGELDCLYYQKYRNLCTRCDVLQSKVNCCRNLFPKCRSCSFEPRPFENGLLNEMQ